MMLSSPTAFSGSGTAASVGGNIGSTSGSSSSFWASPAALMDYGSAILPSPTLHHQQSGHHLHHPSAPASSSAPSYYSALDYPLYANTGIPMVIPAA